MTDTDRPSAVAEVEDMRTSTLTVTGTSEGSTELKARGMKSAGVNATTLAATCQRAWAGRIEGTAARESSCWTDEARIACIEPCSSTSDLSR